MPTSVLLARGFLPPLRDAEGNAYESAVLPCSTEPHRWDDDATKAERVAAAKLCWTCPAMSHCDERRQDLGPLASGVWAAVLLPRQSVIPVVYDATVAAWFEQSGTKVPGEAQA